MRKRYSLMRILLISTVLAACSCVLLAQNPQLQTKNGRRFPTIAFTSVLWSANPSYYSLATDSTGAATYQSAQDSTDRTGVPYSLVFQASEATRRTIFNIAQRLNFFRGDFPVTVASPANNPVRTLAYHDLTFNNQLTYSESTDTEIQELTSIFEEVSATFEFARRLAYLHLHDQKALESELKTMRGDAEHHLLRELQAVAPVLRSIASDPNLDEDVRKESEAILALAHRP